MTKQHRSKNGGNDAYFTNPEYARHCVDTLASLFPFERFRSIVEPSAGNGSFLNLLPARANGYDIEPKSPRVIASDFFNVAVPKGAIVVGNPPFGFAASLAVRFFNHAAQGANVIAFIVPRSFQKDSIQRRLDARFHLVYEEICPKNSFLVEGGAYDVPCVFQVWEKRKQSRTVEQGSKGNPYLVFVNKNDADFSIRRVGGRAGQSLDGCDWSENTTLFVKAVRPDARLVVDLCFSAFEALRDNTAGVRSVSKSEINAVLTAFHTGASHD